jgi:hypothetical protein
MKWDDFLERLRFRHLLPLQFPVFCTPLSIQGFHLGFDKFFPISHLNHTQIALSISQVSAKPGRRYHPIITQNGLRNHLTHCGGRRLGRLYSFIIFHSEIADLSPHTMAEQSCYC